MLTDEIRSDLLVDELQLDGRLNDSLTAGDRADFGLLLSMLSHDVTDFPEFSDRNPQMALKRDLRRKFELPPEEPRYASEDDFERESGYRELLGQGGHRAVFLSQCLQRSPLTPFDHDFPPEIVSQLPPLQQEKLRIQEEGRKVEHFQLEEKGDGFGVLSEIEGARKLHEARLLSKLSS